MFRQCSLAIFASFALAGCLAPRTDPKLQLAASKMPIFGEWSEPLAGLRCRIRLLSTHIHETESILAAVEIANDSNRAVRIDLSSRQQPSLIWSVGETLFLARSDPQQAQKIRLSHGQTREIGRTWLAIAPAVKARSGPQKIAASVAIGEERLSAPPVDVWIAPATWGPPVQGVRLCLGAEKETFASSETIRLLLYVQNMRRTVLTFGVPDWFSPSVRSEDGRVTLIYAPGSDAIEMHHQPGLIQRHVLDVSSVFTRPGSYHVRVQLDGLPVATSAHAGQPLLSNDVLIRVQP
jgi:hypothetical protein